MSKVIESSEQDVFVNRTDRQVPTASKKMLWAGRIVTALPVLMLLFSGVMKLAKPAPVVEGFAKLGYPEHLALGIGILEIACTILYIIPQTAVLGAILLTGYLAARRPRTCASAIRISRPSSSAWSSGSGSTCATRGCGR